MVAATFHQMHELENILQKPAEIHTFTLDRYELIFLPNQAYGSYFTLDDKT